MYISYREQGHACSGLFAEIGGSGCVKNLGLEDVDMPCVISYAGCLAGSSRGSVTNCYATGRISSYGEYVGGLIGCNHDSGSVIGCYSDVEVKGLRYVGGLVGYHQGNIISNCFASGSVMNQKMHDSTRWPVQVWHIGGLVGYVEQDAAVIHCAAHGAVTGGDGSWSMGGLAGTDAGGLLVNCYATGNVTAGDTVDALGGLIGDASEETTVVRCYSASRLRAGADARSLGGLIGWSDTRSVRDCYFLAQEDGGGPDNGIGVSLRRPAVGDPESFVGWDVGPSDVDGLLRPWVMSPDHGPELSVLRDTTLSVLEGHGTRSDPYRIRSGSDLTWVALHPHAAYRLEADLDLGARPWAQAVVPCLAGVLDGNGHTVGNVDIAGHGCVGLFSFLGRRAAVAHLNLVGGDIQLDGAGSRIGMLAGINAGTLVACTVSDARIRGAQDSRVLGGLVGKNVAGTICSCTADAMVGGRECSYIGGLVGQHDDGTIRNCLAQGRVISGISSQHVGGLVGGSTDVIMNCLSLATVSNDSTRSYHGGLLGSGYWVNDSYYLSEQDGGGPDRGKGSPLTSEQMRKGESFVGWDFTGSSADGTVNAWTLSAAESHPSLSVSAGYAPPALQGSGSPADPYMIGSAEELGAMYYRPDRHYRLNTDVDCSGIQWTGAIVPYFTGSLDGRGYSLSGMRLTGQRLLGLFGVIARQGRASGLVFDRVDIAFEDHCTNVGSLAANNEGLVQDCHGSTPGLIHGGDWNHHIGGLIGQNDGLVRRCSSLLPIRMAFQGYGVGGLVGKNRDSGLLSECWADCEIVCGDDGDYLGGLVGSHDGRIIVNCYAFGSIVAGPESEFLGGLAGGNGRSLVTTCYAAGSVTAPGGSDIGGVVGYNMSWNERYVEDCYFLAPSDGGGPDNGLGSPLTRAEMSRPESFVGWDFVGETENGTDDVWVMFEELAYPLLVWQTTAGPPTSPDGSASLVSAEGFESVSPSYAVGENFQEFWGANRRCVRLDLV